MINDKYFISTYLFTDQKVNQNQIAVLDINRLVSKPIDQVVDTNYCKNEELSKNYTEKIFTINKTLVNPLYDASAEQYNNIGIINHSNCKESTLKEKNTKRSFIFYKIQFAEDIPFYLQLSNECVIYDVATLRPIIKIHPQKYLGPVNQETLEIIKKLYRYHRPTFGL